LARPDVDSPPGAKRIATIRKALLNWWRPARRDLPWRPGADPYAVWVSEIMLQQTRVETVKPYYRRFLNRFPGVGSLAAARIGEVLKVWEGLGYYHRARNLHRSARLIARRGGRLPTTAREWMKLPGVGRYTAAAIASIAFGRDEAALDGNVARVLCRMFLVRRLPSRPGVKKFLESLAGRLIPPGRAGQWNQAMMDLGATVCTPAAPRCDVCPPRRSYGGVDAS
jgi:A/G-specific adenine glycosylase